MRARVLRDAVAIGLVAASFLAATDADAARRPSRRSAGGDTSRPETPEIRTSNANRVPVCVTPDKLMRTLGERNERLDERFKTIAAHYKKHGEALGVRWDYAFYQMVLETNYLAFRRGSGEPGDVRAQQNNFAGLGATGNGVRGEAFRDVSSGVLAQLQHLVAYAGERVDNPVAQRTRENQDDIIAKSRKLNRAVRYGDLTNRWAADRNYARSINAVAERFQSAACNGVPGEQQAAAPDAAPQRVETPRRKGRDLAKRAIEASKADNAPAAALGAGIATMPAAACTVLAASFGGTVTLLIRTAAADGVTFTALSVAGGSEQAMADSYIKTHTAGGQIAGRFKSRDEAVAHAYDLCDSGKP